MRTGVVALGLVLAVSRSAGAQSFPIPAPGPPGGAAGPPGIPADKQIRQVRAEAELAVRLGAGLPLGGLVQGAPMRDEYYLKLPAELELGAFVGAHVSLALNVSYALLIHADTCAERRGCSFEDVSFGLQGNYHLTPTRPIDPWLGVVLGYEILGELAGPQAALQGGAGFRLNDGLRIGPYASLSLGQFSNTSGEDFSNGVGVVPSEALHSWLTVGARGSFGF